MKMTFFRYALEIAVFILVSVIALEFIDNKIYIYIAGMIGYILSKMAGDIADLVYYRNEITETHGAE